MPGSLSLRKKLGQLFFIGIDGARVDEQTRKLLDEISPGGVCLFTRNIREAAQTRELTDALRETSKTPLLLSVDQEGGLVDRLRRIMTPMPAANKVRSDGDATELAAIIAEALLQLGLNMDFAPVVDVIDEKRAAHTNGLFSREFGRSPDDVVSLAGAFLTELQKGGVVGCLKHFPGLGASTIDSHEELPSVDLSEAELDSTDLIPYKRLTNAARAVMVAHATFPRHPLQEKDQHGKLLPSSLSFNFITKLLRERLGFNGLVITDDLEMGAIIKNYGVGDACVRAINAGADMLAICADPERIRAGYRSVIAAVEDGTISGERIDAVTGRIAHAKSLLTEPPAFSADRFRELSDRTAALNARLG
ncbi:MAG: hypothetical protein JO053_07780 [Acidobacteria bacterium]|nr:hypothetical protein [Acidobacteriota bacterium]